MCCGHYPSQAMSSCIVTEVLHEWPKRVTWFSSLYLCFILADGVLHFHSVIRLLSHLNGTAVSRRENIVLRKTCVTFKWYAQLFLSILLQVTKTNSCAMREVCQILTQPSGLVRMSHLLSSVKQLIASSSSTYAQNVLKLGNWTNLDLYKW